MKITDLNQLYIEELRDLYSAETQIVDALPKISNAVESPTLKTALDNHCEQSRGHVIRLETIFRDLGISPKGGFCEATKGLLREGQDLTEKVESGPVRDAGLIGAAQRVEHYEISAYGTTRTFANLLGQEGHAALLQETLDEEFIADSNLTKLAVSQINYRALNVANTVQASRREF